MRFLIRQNAKADIFSTICQNTKLFSENVNLCFEPTRLFIQTMDGSHVSVIEIAIPREWFDEYDLGENDAGIVMGISMPMLSKVLSTRDKSQKFEVAFDPESDKLSIHFTSRDDDTSSVTAAMSALSTSASVNATTRSQIFDKHFEINTIELESDMLQIPESEYQAEITVSSSHFASLISQLRLFGDTMDITCSEEKIMIYSHTQESGKMAVEMKIEDLTSFAINEGETVELSYALSYISNMCQFHKVAKEIQIYLTADSPMKLTYLFGGDNVPGAAGSANISMTDDDDNTAASNNMASISFYLAPKIQDD